MNGLRIAGSVVGRRVLLGLVVAVVVAVGLPGGTADALAPPAATNVTSVAASPFGQDMLVRWTGPKTGITQRTVSTRIGATGTWSDPALMNVAYNASSAKVGCPSTDPDVGCSFKIFTSNAAGPSPEGTSGDGLWLASPAQNVTTKSGPTVGYATVSWTPPASTGGLAITRYSVQVS